MCKTVFATKTISVLKLRPTLGDVQNWIFWPNTPHGCTQLNLRPTNFRINKTDCTTKPISGCEVSIQDQTQPRMYKTKSTPSPTSGMCKLEFATNLPQDVQKWIYYQTTSKCTKSDSRPTPLDVPNCDTKPISGLDLRPTHLGIYNTQSATKLRMFETETTANPPQDVQNRIRDQPNSGCTKLNLRPNPSQHWICDQTTSGCKHWIPSQDAQTESATNPAQDVQNWILNQLSQEYTKSNLRPNYS